MKKLLLITGALLMHSTFAAEQNQNAAIQGVNKQQMTFAQLDANADGVLSQDEVRGRLLADFNNLDSGASGTLSADEFNARVNRGKQGRQGRPTFEQLDLNSDAMLDKNEVRGRLLANFDTVDSDASGTLSADEFNAHVKMGKQGIQGHHKGHHKGNGDNRATFAQLDINNDGLLAKDEVRGRLLADFDDLDSDASGTLSADELKTRASIGKQGRQGHHQGNRDYRPNFERFDLNSDGVISAEEFNAVVNHS
jgi:Ca2+-binding EF-hand superfamily protein